MMEIKQLITKHPVLYNRSITRVIADNDTTIQRVEGGFDVDTGEMVHFIPDSNIAEVLMPKLYRPPGVAPEPTKKKAKKKARGARK